MSEAKETVLIKAGRPKGSSNKTAVKKKRKYTRRAVATTEAKTTPKEFKLDDKVNAHGLNGRVYEVEYSCADSMSFFGPISTTEPKPKALKVALFKEKGLVSKEHFEIDGKAEGFHKIPSLFHGWLK